MKARWVLTVLIVVCVTACGEQNNGIVMIATPGTFPVADAVDVAFDLALDVADTQPLPDTHDTSPPPDVHDTIDTTPLPDMLDASEPDVPCVPDCEAKECGDDGCGGSCGVCINPCDPCGVEGGPWEDPNLCMEPEGVCATVCCPLCCDDLECVDDQCGGICGVCDPPELSSFSFLANDNPSLEGDIQLNIQNNTITGNVPYSGAIDNLVATYSHNGSAVLVGSLTQTSGTSHNDFSHVVTYSVISLDGKQASYDVRVRYFTGLPIFYIDTNGVAINSKVYYTEGNASIFGGLDYEDSPIADMEIRGRGHSTWGVHPKKPYQLNYDDKTEVLGMPEDKKWIFLAEYSDKTMMRTTIAFEMGYISNLDWTPESHFAEVFLNNEYNGTYNIAQKVEETDNRVDLGDAGYLLEIENINHIEAGDVYFYTGSFLIKIKEPDLTEGSDEYLYIEEYINEFEAVLMGDDFANPITGYASYIDMDSFVDWYLINEITKEVDSKSYSSIYLTAIPGEKIKMGPLWDFDLSFGNVNYAASQYPEGFWIKDNPWYSRLFQDPDFVTQVKSRFTYFMDNKDYILDKMDFYADYLSLAQEENNAKWNTIGIYVWPNPVVYDTYEEEVVHLKTWYIERMDWLDTAINNL
ncbi:MAG: CotH kinase family protein [Pseudomonadota bacterium]